MNFLPRFRRLAEAQAIRSRLEMATLFPNDTRFYTTYVKVQSLSSFFKENSLTILAAAMILTGVFAAGVYVAQTASDIEVLELKIKRTERRVMALEEKINTTEEKGRRRVMALEEKINTTEEKIKSYLKSKT